MAINIDSYIDVQYSGDTVTRIGLSAGMDTISNDDILSYIFCASYNKLIHGVVPRKEDVSMATYRELIPFNFELDDPKVVINVGGYDTNPNGIFMGVIWLYTDIFANHPENNGNLSHFKIVMDWDAPNYYATCPAPNGKRDNITSWSSGDGTKCYATSGTYTSLTYVYNGHDITVSDIYPYMVFKVQEDGNDILFISCLRQNANTFRCRPFTKGSQIRFIGTTTLKSFRNNEQTYSPVGGKMVTYEKTLPYSWNMGASPGQASANPNAYGNTEMTNLFFYTEGGSNAGSTIGSMDWTWFLNTRRESLLFWASGGLKFKAGNYLYKPIIQNGIVIDYSDNMDAESDLDDWSGSTNHGIPITPPSPPGPGPYDDDPWSGVSFSGVGVGGAGAFAKCYYMTSTELANLRTWMNSINVPEGFDPMQQIIGLSQVPVALSGSGSENVVFVNSSAVYDPGVTTRAVDTGVATQQAIGTPISYYLGSVDIVRRMQERGEPYLDYDCQIELYLPLIGMFSLDTQAVMGRTISAHAVLDPISGTLAAYAYVTKDGQNLPVAYGSTTIGVDLPISAQQLSVSRAALKQANAQLGASLLSGALTMLAAASSGKASGTGAKTSTGSSGLSAAGIREAGSDYMKASQVGNVFGDFMNWGRTIRQLSYGNNTAVAGSFGGSTAQWSYPFTPYVKIIRPRYEKPSNYAHSQGVPCVQTKTIGSCTGFIQCIGADVSGISGATDLELQAIQAALSNGIYAGGGQK